MKERYVRWDTLNERKVGNDACLSCRGARQKASPASTKPSMDTPYNNHNMFESPDPRPSGRMPRELGTLEALHRNLAQYDDDDVSVVAFGGSDFGCMTFCK